MKRNRNRIKYQELYHSTIFSEVYKKNAWGGKKGEFYSGTGSHNPQVKDYSKTIALLIQSNQIFSIVEIGCGDFNVTNTILSFLNANNYNFSYLGYDVVKPLIKRNKSLYLSSNVKFICRDSCNGKIAGGDLLIVRQVLQHLDNKSIKKIIEKFNDYKFIIISEHQPSDRYGDSIIPNQEKKTDASNRVMFRSGVYLEKEPFNCKINALIHSIPERLFGLDASINTFLIKTTTDEIHSIAYP